MFIDPSGHGIITSIIIGGFIAVAMSYGEDLYEEIESDGFQRKDLWTPFAENWKEYTVDFLEGAVIAAAFYSGLGLNGESIKCAVDLGQKISYTFFVSSTAGFGIYTLETLGFGNGKFNFNEMLDYGFGLGFESLKNYAVGGIVGNLGLAPKKRSSIKDLVNITVVKNLFLLPIELIEDAAQ